LNEWVQGGRDETRPSIKNSWRTQKKKWGYIEKKSKA